MKLKEKKRKEIENMIIISIEIYFCDIVSDVEVRLLKLKETKEKKRKEIIILMKIQACKADVYIYISNAN